MKIVPFGEEHLEDLVRLNAVCGFPERSAAGWRWALLENPDQQSEPIGYVALRKGIVAGFLGTQRRVFRRAGEKVAMVNGHTLVTDLKSPGTGISLLSHGIASTSAVAVYTLNNNALSAKIYPRFGLLPWRGEAARGFLERPLKFGQIATSAALRRLASQSESASLMKREWFAGRRSLVSTDCAPLIPIDPFSDEGAALLDRFNARLGDGPRFRGRQCGAVWRYRLSDPDHPGSIRLFGRMRKGGLVAILAVGLAKESALSVPVLEIEDLACLPDHENLLPELFSAAVGIGKASGAARVRCRMVPDEWFRCSEPLPGWRWRSRSYDSAHAMSQRGDILSDWAVGIGDGDFFFALRRPQRRQAPERVGERPTRRRTQPANAVPTR